MNDKEYLEMISMKDQYEPPVGYVGFLVVALAGCWLSTMAMTFIWFWVAS